MDPNTHPEGCLGFRNLTITLNLRLTFTLNLALSLNLTPGKGVPKIRNKEEGPDPKWTLTLTRRGAWDS